MQSLKTLVVGDGAFSTNCTITYLPSSLRVIDWTGYPSISLPESFEPSQLAMLWLRKSRLVELWPLSKKLSNLKNLDLCKSLGLTKTPNFGDMPNLEKLNLEGCVNLKEVDPSLGHCRMLTYLSLEGCSKLEKLPKFDCMESLETLNLCGCTSLQEFPEICGDMQRLSILHLESPWIRSLPPCLSGLQELHLAGCEILESIPDTIQNLSNLSIFNCNKLATLPNNLFESQQLEYLYIDQCSRLVNLPSSLGVQKNLLSLEINSCENLKELPSSIQMESLLFLMISNYPKLDTFPQINGDMHCLKILNLNSTGIREVPSSIENLDLTELNLTGCEDLVSLPDSICYLMNLQCLSLRGCKKLEKLPENIDYLRALDMLEDLSESDISLHSLEKLDVSGSNISCLPKGFRGLLHLQHLNVQFCQNLNELPSGKLTPNLKELFADYDLALKSIRDLVINCLKLYRFVISAVSSEQVNVFLHHFLTTCFQCDFHQRDYFVVSFRDQVRIPELFDYHQLIHQKEISIDLKPSWYTDKFMGFLISYGPTGLKTKLEVTLVCKSDPERKYSLKYNNFDGDLGSENPLICCIYIPFKTLWNGSGNKEGKNPNDYYILEFSHMFWRETIEACWGFRLVYEEEAMSDTGHRKKNRRINE